MNTIKGMLVKCRNITNTFVSVLLYSLMGQEKKNKEIRIKNKEDKKKEIRKEEENTNGFRKYKM